MRFGEQIMRRFNSLARDLGTSEGVCPAKPVAAFADRARMLLN
jgi:hypothetical protein